MKKKQWQINLDIGRKLKMIYCFDIDGTICTFTDGRYNEAKPFKDRINQINKLYKDGNIIKLFTARGSTTKINWFTFTENQLKDWGLKYHELILGKPHADIFIDDKSVHSESWFFQNEISSK